MVKNPSIKAEDTGSISDPGRSHMLCSTCPPEHRLWSPGDATIDAHEP